MTKNEAKPILGERLKVLRDERHLGLSELAERTNIARSTLYKVENNGMSLTYDKLLELSKGLGVEVSELFTVSQPTLERTVLGRREFGSIEEGYVVDTKNYRYTYLCSELMMKDMVPMLGIVKARSLEEFGDLVTHDGEEFTVVLEGEIEVHTPYYKPLRLKKNQYLYMDSSTPHAYLSVGEGDARTLCICSSKAIDADEADRTSFE